MKLYNKRNHMFTGPSPPHHRSKRGLQRQRSPAPFSGGAPLQLCVAAVCAGDSPRPGQVAFCSKYEGNLTDCREDSLWPEGTAAKTPALSSPAEEGC